MECLTTRETAEKWNVSIRGVQNFLADGRIPGAKRLGRNWAIPSDAEKPADQRHQRKVKGSRECPSVPFLMCYLPLPKGDANGAEEMLETQDERIQLRAEIAVMRGEFETAVRLCESIPESSPIKICAYAKLMEAAIATGNFPQYVRANSYLMVFAGNGKRKRLRWLF